MMTALSVVDELGAAHKRIAELEAALDIAGAREAAVCERLGAASERIVALARDLDAKT